MSKKTETNQKHMNQDNRVVIEKRLDASVSFRAIGIEPGKDPFVCNGCPKKNPCRLDKYYYRAVRAQNEYKTILIESRRGINLTEAEPAALDATLTCPNGLHISPATHMHQRWIIQVFLKAEPTKIMKHS